MQQKIWPTFVDFGLVDRDYTFLKNFISKEESQLAQIPMMDRAKDKISCYITQLTTHGVGL